MPQLDAAKLAALKNLLKKNKLDGFVISDFHDFKYFFGGAILGENEAVLLAHTKGLYVAARSLYADVFNAKFPQIKTDGCDYDRAAKIVETAKKLGIRNMGFDGTKELYGAGKAYAKAGFKEIPGFIDALRVAKTSEEIAIMKDSAKILYGALKYIRKFLKPGVSEYQIARLLEDYMFNKGASGTSFPTIVAFGVNTFDPHYRGGGAKLKNNMPVMIDFGCIYKGYCSDITRTFWYGSSPSAEFEKILKTVKEAHDKAVKETKYGMSGAQIDSIARNHIEAAGYGKYFTHRTGHGIGLQDHEAADISQLNKEKIGLNYCFSIEPGIYLPGKFGARYEDCFCMTKKGMKRLG